MAVIFVKIKDGKIKGLMGITSDYSYGLVGDYELKLEQTSGEVRKLSITKIANYLNSFHIEVTDSQLKSLVGHKFNSDYVLDFLHKILPPELWL